MTKIYKNKTEKQKIGEIGESLACRFLEGKGYKIIGRNYLKPYGEIDIIAQKSKEVVFIEVKSVTRLFNSSEISRQTNMGVVSYETNDYRPEDNLHSWKLKRLTKTINTYLIENNIEEGDWRFDVVTIFINPETKQAKVEHLENIVL